MTCLVYLPNTKITRLNQELLFQELGALRTTWVDLYFRDPEINFQFEVEVREEQEVVEYLSRLCIAGWNGTYTTMYYTLAGIMHKFDEHDHAEFMQGFHEGIDMPPVGYLGDTAEYVPF